MKRMFITTAVSLSLSLAGVACDDQDASPASSSPDDAVPSGVTRAALDVELALRTLDREGDPQLALSHLESALDQGTLTPEERARAIVGISRVHEVQGQRALALEVVEAELERPRTGNERRSSSRHEVLRERLRELLESDRPRLPSLVQDTDAAPFAIHLASYFAPAPDAGVSVAVHFIGGRREVSEALGTFDLASGYRAARERTCPLCNEHVSIQSSTSRTGDWASIPESRDDIANSVAVFYFDLERHRIPARYEALLPLSVGDIETQLATGRGFAVARRRENAPPIILIAAPRTVMLEEVEAALAEATELPLEPMTVTLSPSLRPREIKTVLRKGYFGAARACYEEVLDGRPGASGKASLRLEVDGDGGVVASDVTLEGGLTDDAALRDCLQHPLPNLVFPATGDTVVIRYPVTFSPE
ncbi:MAG: hypothetical protein AAF715_22605 [Myxococcota bacterium]